MTGTVRPGLSTACYCVGWSGHWHGIIMSDVDPLYIQFHVNDDLGSLNIGRVCPIAHSRLGGDMQLVSAEQLPQSPDMFSASFRRIFRRIWAQTRQQVVWNWAVQCQIKNRVCVLLWSSFIRAKMFQLRVGGRQAEGGRR